MALTHFDAAGRAAVFDRLAALSPKAALPPRDGFVTGDAGASEALRGVLGLPTK